MIYVSDNTAHLITINGTTDTNFCFVNNQTLQRYELNLWVVSICPNISRKQISFMLQWNNIAQAETPTAVVDGINILNIPAGEYTYDVCGVKGLMILKAKQENGITYDNEQKNIVYNG